VCNENIQGVRKYTCAQYSTFIAFELLTTKRHDRHNQILLTTEDINKICSRLASRMKNHKNNRRLDETIIHLKSVFHQFIIENYSSNETIFEYGNKVMTGAMKPIQKLQCAIFRMMSDIAKVSSGADGDSSDVKFLERVKPDPNFNDGVLHDEVPENAVWVFLRQKLLDLREKKEDLLTHFEKWQEHDIPLNRKQIRDRLNNIKIEIKDGDLEKFLQLMFHKENKEKKIHFFDMVRLEKLREYKNRLMSKLSQNPVEVANVKDDIIRIEFSGGSKERKISLNKPHFDQVWFW
jgi:hypothetical protein